MKLSPLLLLACFALAACGGPTPAPEGESPGPEAGAAGEQGHTALREAIEEPLDKARTVEDTQADRNAEREQALEDAGG